VLSPQSSLNHQTVQSAVPSAQPTHRRQTTYYHENSATLGDSHQSAPISTAAFSSSATSLYNSQNQNHNQSSRARYTSSLEFDPRYNPSTNSHNYHNYHSSNNDDDSAVHYLGSVHPPTTTTFYQNTHNNNNNNNKSATTTILPTVMPSSGLSSTGNRHNRNPSLGTSNGLGSSGSAIPLPTMIIRRPPPRGVGTCVHLQSWWKRRRATLLLVGFSFYILLRMGLWFIDEDPSAKDVFFLKVEAKRLAVIVPFATNQLDDLLYSIRHRWRGSATGRIDTAPRKGRTKNSVPDEYVTACLDQNAHGQYIDLVFFLSGSFAGVPEMQEQILHAVQENPALYGCYNEVLFLSARSEGSLLYADDELDEHGQDASAAEHRQATAKEPRPSAKSVAPSSSPDKRGTGTSSFLPQQHRGSRSPFSSGRGTLQSSANHHGGRQPTPVAAQLSAEEAAQVQSAQQRQFYKLFHMAAILEHYDYFFWMTLDVYPIREHWLDVVYKQVLTSHYHYFWVKGSPVLPNCLPHNNIQNRFTLSPTSATSSLLDVLDSTLITSEATQPHHEAELQLHKPDCDFSLMQGHARRIHASALYRLGDKEFDEFIERARRSAVSRSQATADPLASKSPAIAQTAARTAAASSTVLPDTAAIQRAGGEAPSSASAASFFDTVLFEYLHQESNLHLLSRLGSRFAYSEFIQALHIDSVHSSEVHERLTHLTADDFSPQTYLVHLSFTAPSA